jgi:hypothetical protein
MNKLKTTQASGLTDRELELWKIVADIRFAKSTLQGIIVLDKYLDKFMSRNGNTAEP